MKKHLKRVVSFVLSLTMVFALLPASAFALEIEAISSDESDNSAVTGILGVTASTGLDQYGYGTLWTLTAENDGYLIGTAIGGTTWYIGSDEDGALALTRTPENVSITDTAYNDSAAVLISTTSSTKVFYLVSVSETNGVAFASVETMTSGGQYYLYDVEADAYTIASTVTTEGETQTSLVNSLNLTRTVSEEYLSESSDDTVTDASEVEFTYVLYHNDVAEAGVEYSLYDADGNLAGAGITGDTGEFTFKNGYTVTFSGIAMDESNSWYAAEKVSVFVPSSITVSCTYASKTKKATVNVVTSKDVSYVTINDVAVSAKTVSGKYRFSKSYSKVALGTTYEIIAYDANGVASATYIATAE